MATDTGAIERALGAIGTTFRLARLYPPTHPAVVEALRQVTAALPALGTVEWKIGATGLHWHGQHLLPRNSQVAELAGLLYARGMRSIQVHPGLVAEHVLALFGVAIGSVQPDDAALGQITLTAAQGTQRLSTSTPVSETPAIEIRARAPTPPARPAPPAAAADALARRASVAFRPDVVPVDVQVKRAITGVTAADTLDAQRAAVEQLQAMTPSLLALKDLVAVAEAIGGLDRLLLTVSDSALLTAIGAAAEALADRATVERMVGRLREPRVPPAEREALVAALGALAALSAEPVLHAYVGAPGDHREPSPGGIRPAG